MSSTFYKTVCGCSQLLQRRDVPKLLTDKMNAELLHLFMQQNCLEQYLVLWRVTVQWTLVDSENVSIHAIHRFHFTVNKIKAQSWKTLAQRQQFTVRTRTRVQYL